MSAHLKKVLRLHFDPDGGSPYWLRRAAGLGFDPRKDIASVEDLSRFGPFPMEDLLRTPVTDFIPRTFAHRPLVLTETGGGTGTPKTTAYFPEEFHAAFVEPFLIHWRAAAQAGAVLDGTGHWLWLGPTGPHIAGKTARRIAELTTGSDGFCIDFDPRWYRTLSPGSGARDRYMGHLLAQASRCLAVQPIRYFFATPMVLLALAPELPVAQREGIRFVYLGGMEVAEEELAILARAFPQALLLAGYGNSLYGVCHELAATATRSGPPVYRSPGERLVLRVVPVGHGPSPSERLSRQVAPGERGQVMFHRLDESGFLPNCLVRDSAVRISTAEFEGIAAPAPAPIASQGAERGGH
jgi:hypothetical protein